MEEQERGTGSWRTHHYAIGMVIYTHTRTRASGSIYEFRRGEDQFSSIVSFSSPAKGRKLYAEKIIQKNTSGMLELKEETLILQL